jgi:hypothetical protein
MLGHDYVASDEEFVPDAYGFQGALEKTSRGRRAEMRKTVVAGESHEVEVAHQLIPDEASGHGAIVHPNLRQIL